MMTCDAQLGWKGMNGPFLVACELEADHLLEHRGVWRGYDETMPGTTITWMEHDRRTFRGTWTECSDTRCVLPAGHVGHHAY